MRSRGQHRKPSRAAKIIAPGITAGAIVSLAATGANAQVTPSGSSHGSAVMTSAFVHQYVPRHALEEVTVGPGDSLSRLAGKYCGNPKDWTGWWNYNHHHLGWRDPDVIKPGQRVIPDCRDEQVWLPQPKVVTVAYSTPERSGGYHSYSGGSYGDVNPGGYSGYQQCVVTRESGGQSQVMNSSGHYGLYQFDEGTWVSGGGNAGDFGHASIAEQNAVFAAVYAARGTSPWSPSDGC
jgi:hypothetical protein